jgi:NRAMP (natural resistance-associated macrophage protein)-like metal ion transporter
MKSSPGKVSKIKRFFRIFGPGLITGASDDDPSGIATYLQAGAKFGFSMLWTALLSFPLMAGMQEMCARIGLVTSQGLTLTIKRNYPKILLYLILAFSIPAITLNIGADIQATGAVAHMLYSPIPTFVYCIVFTGLLIFVIVKFPFKKISSILKWLCLSLLLYIIVPFMIKEDWLTILKHTIIPSIRFDKDFLSILVAILGTTISPYLFFWQTTMESEDQAHRGKKKVVNRKILLEMEADVNGGMLLSIMVMFFMILTAGSVLSPAGIKDINTVDQAAKALEPLTGKLSYLIFAVAVLGTGFLTIPVLTACQSYILAEAFGWKEGLDKKIHQAKGFNYTLIISLLVGLSLDFLGINPIKALLYAAILYGLTAPVIIAVILHIGNNRKIMKSRTNNWLSNVLGILTLFLMTIAAILLIYFLFR